MSIDLYFRLNSLADFMDDLDAFSADTGWPSPVQTDEDGVRFLPSMVSMDNLRIDFDYIEDLVGVPAEFDDEGNKTADAIMRGPHLNLLLSMIRDTPTAQAVMDQVASDLEGWFASKTESGTDTPQAMLDRLGITQASIPTRQRKTAKPTGLINRDSGGVTLHTPEVPKRVFA